MLLLVIWAVLFVLGILCFIEGIYNAEVVDSTQPFLNDDFLESK